MACAPLFLSLHLGFPLHSSATGWQVLRGCAWAELQGLVPQPSSKKSCLGDILVEKAGGRGQPQEVLSLGLSLERPFAPLDSGHSVQGHAGEAGDSWAAALAWPEDTGPCFGLSGTWPSSYLLSRLLSPELIPGVGQRYGGGTGMQVGAGRMWGLGSPYLVPMDHWPLLSALVMSVKMLLMHPLRWRHRVSVAEGLCLPRV